MESPPPDASRDELNSWDLVANSLSEDNYSDWDKLPDLILENVFSLLSTRDKYWASMTCKNWYRAFYSPKTWYMFVLDDYTLTRKKFNYYSGWQYVLDHYRTMQCINNIGHHIRYLIFEPMMNFYNLYEFMNMFSYYAEENDKIKHCGIKQGIGQRIRGLKFVFPCTMRQKAEVENVRIFGTGGQILASLKRLMSNLKCLKKLELIDLMLEYNDANHLLDEVCNQCCLQLETLVLVNTTKDVHPLLHPGVFLNLNILVISPQNLCNDLIQLLGYTAIRHLHIKSNLYSPSIDNCPTVSPKIWQQCKKDNPKLAVHIECEKGLFWQYNAPVKSLIINSSKEMICTDVVISAVENYSFYLEAFVHHKIPRRHRSKSFHDRADGPVMLLCRQCPNLQTLVINERMSTATVLLIASTSKNLKNFVVRKNAVIIRSDWPKSSEWSDEFHAWLKIKSRNYVSVEEEVSQILGYRWKMLSDKEFKNFYFQPYKRELFSELETFIGGERRNVLVWNLAQAPKTKLISVVVNAKTLCKKVAKLLKALKVVGENKNSIPSKKY